MRVLDVSSEETSNAWLCFRGSVVQRVLSNDLVQHIEELRCALETCVPDKLIEHQAELRETRRLLNVIHSHDTDEIKRIYE